MNCKKMGVIKLAGLETPTTQDGAPIQPPPCCAQGRRKLIMETRLLIFATSSWDTIVGDRFFAGAQNDGLNKL